MSVTLSYNKGSGRFYNTGVGGVPISFSSLRTNFKEQNSGSVSASELVRNTNLGDTNPIVPDSTENRSTGIVDSRSNWKVSHFYQSIKYYTLIQTGTDEKLDIDAQSWNVNMTKNIKKYFYVDGTIGSSQVANYAATFDTLAYNFIIETRSGGNISGAGGSRNSGNGGPALYVNSSGSSVLVYVNSNSYIRGGGGGGGKGGTGWTGPNGPCWQRRTYSVRGFCEGCDSCGNPNNPITINGVRYNSYGARAIGGCSGQRGCACAFGWYNGIFCTRTKLSDRQCEVYDPTSKPGAPGGLGGNGGQGIGYGQSRENGFAGVKGTAANCPTYATAGEDGRPGGNGGEWGQSGGSTVRDAASLSALQQKYYVAPSPNFNGIDGGSPGRSISGSNYRVDGVISNILGPR